MCAPDGRVRERGVEHAEDAAGRGGRRACAGGLERGHHEPRRAERDERLDHEQRGEDRAARIRLVPGQRPRARASATSEKRTSQTARPPIATRAEAAAAARRAGRGGRLSSQCAHHRSRRTPSSASGRRKESPPNGLQLDRRDTPARSAFVRYRVARSCLT